jgi:hypothetical protein
MLAKPLDLIVGQSTTKAMDRMTEQLAQMVAPVNTTTWGGLHGSLALILDDADYATVTKNIVTLVALLSKPTTINPKINILSDVSCLEIERYHTNVLLAHLTKVRR